MDRKVERPARGLEPQGVGARRTNPLPRTRHPEVRFKSGSCVFAARAADFCAINFSFHMELPLRNAHTRRSWRSSSLTPGGGRLANKSSAAAGLAAPNGWARTQSDVITASTGTGLSPVILITGRFASTHKRIRVSESPLPLLISMAPSRSTSSCLNRDPATNGLGVNVRLIFPSLDSKARASNASTLLT